MYKLYICRYHNQQLVTATTSGLLRCCLDLAAGQEDQVAGERCVHHDTRLAGRAVGQQWRRVMKLTLSCK